MTPPSILIENLSKRYGKFTALDHLDLDLEGAKCVGFLGPNGAGKTTTLKMATDMIFPTEGRVLLNGEPVRENRERALSYCGVLIESPEIYPSLSPREALEMAADVRNVPLGERRRRIDDVLAEVKMADWADKKVGRFSKGMKQRINLAAALVHDPQILILDEPASGLDPRGMAEVRDIVRGLKQRNRLVFMSSHILQEVTDVCDEVALINHGKLLFYDTLANVTSRFSHGKSTVDAAFASSVETATSRIGALEGVEQVDSLEPNRVRIQFSGGLDTQKRLLKGLVALDLDIVSFRESGNSLEEIYLEQVTKGD
ncbi:MAG: ABC transporter ATP-binding protein [Nitrososphaerales archaeon]